MKKNLQIVFCSKYFKRINFREYILVKNNGMNDSNIFLKNSIVEDDKIFIPIKRRSKKALEVSTFSKNLLKSNLNLDQTNILTVNKLNFNKSPLNDDSESSFDDISKNVILKALSEKGLK